MSERINLEAARRLLDAWDDADDMREYELKNWRLIRANYRALLDAASVVPEEPEWEIEVSYSSPSAPSIDGGRLRRAMRAESVEKAREFAALVERPMIRKRTKAIPAGTWVPVEQGGE